MPPLLVKNKVAMVACVADLFRYPMTDGPFMPWYAPTPPGRAAALLDDLKVTVGKMTDIEGWPVDCLTRLPGLVTHRSVFTLTDDLAYFRERSSTAVALSEMLPLCLAQQGGYEGHSILSQARLLSRQGTHRGAIESDELDRLWQSLRSMLGKRALPLEGLGDLAAILFLACFTIITKCEETLANRQIPIAKLKPHAQELSWSIEAGNVLVLIDFLAAPPVRFGQARQVSTATIKSDGGKNAATVKQKKLQPVKEYTLKLANEGNYQGGRSVTIGIRNRVSEL